jgi:hypothetical protein
MGTAIFDFVEDIAKLCIEKLLSDPFAYTIRKESAKCMRFLISACKDHPDKMKTLYIMTYVALIEEMNKRLGKREFEQVNGILKELHKMLREFEFFRDRGLFIYALEDAVTFVNKLGEIVNLTREEKKDRIQSMKKMKSQIDEEELEIMEEDLEGLLKGLHHIMEINGCLMQNMGE